MNSTPLTRLTITAAELKAGDVLISQPARYGQTELRYNVTRVARRKSDPKMVIYYYHSAHLHPTNALMRGDDYGFMKADERITVERAG